MCLVLSKRTLNAIRSTPKSMRNIHIETATDKLIAKVDDLITGGSLSSGIPAKVQKVFDVHVNAQGGSVILACAFFVSYALVDPAWDFRSIPIGIRGGHGDKKLAMSLTSRHVTLHKSITAFGENLGWKGNVRRFDLSTDPRFSGFVTALAALSKAELEQLFEHVAW